MTTLTRERLAKVGIIVQFLALVRTLSEFFRLKYVCRTEFTIAMGEPFIVGALFAAVTCWVAVMFFFFRLIHDRAQSRMVLISSSDVPPLAQYATAPAFCIANI